MRKTPTISRSLFLGIERKCHSRRISAMGGKRTFPTVPFRSDPTGEEDRAVFLYLVDAERCPDSVRAGPSPFHHWHGASPAELRQQGGLPFYRRRAGQPKSGEFRPALGRYLFSFQ